ncbi:family 16 glycoside hydrolase [Thalassoglobus neptunius]|nr:family 16 glycoside hydrolase [Thalassoglobus neptunius]
MRQPTFTRFFLPQMLSFAACCLLIHPALLSASDDPYGGFKMGIQSYSLRGYPVEEALKHSQELGLTYWEAYSKHLPMSTLPSHIEDQKKLLEGSGITLDAYGVVGFDSNENKAREVFDYAKAMGLLSISANPKKDEATFALLDKLVEEYQIPIAIHNHGPGAAYDKVDDVLQWVEGRSPLIGACVDTGHYLRSDEDPVEVIQKLGKRVFGVHLKDVRTIYSDEEKATLLESLPPNRKKHLEQEGKIFTILGEGELNVVGVLRALRNIDFDRNLSLEYEENPENPLSDIELCLAEVRRAVAYLDDEEEEGFVQIWDGETFDDWTINESPETWKIEDGAIVCNGPRSHVFYTGDLAPFKNFELKVDVMAEPNSNGGIYFHTKYQDEGWPKAGFETQVNNTYHKDPRKTGSLYAVDDVNEQHIPDNTWWTQHIIVNGKNVKILVDGKVVTDYTESEGQEPQQGFDRLISEGTFALQGHDPGSTVHFKNIRVKKLP